ncbi:MAG: hypothetical protein COU22_03480 [Candidatus Komeilibacteria bacterium CG10_big_fil_rev_8_21_14_0_10_41_13]|uniref:Type II toxin-antitoxin system mRNA interferase toxin, RelE/StbE family n=1 Tax=Candidatus Komeilibacteria bacterium CG10_big_fil_rev_8_21_14_0_10_41_13 TaxID=1974476 RepID=A0A2M6WBM4_9BACT|nr:MAG: hypothetical protein COU22_03480 [Candidatus Komeilibacteria bacterium CG10_big_fil_rev_8_21_14_0_10_41_13]
MDKIAKALKKLSQTEKSLVKNILQNLEKENRKTLDIKKLKGHEDIFRVRKGKIRIIYRLLENNDMMILAIERRSDKTYRNLK